MARWLFAVLLVVGACGQADVQIDEARLVAAPAGTGAAAAQTCAAFGISDCPRVWFYAPDAACGPAAFSYDGECLGGLQGANGILVLLPDGATQASHTSIVHELAHWAWGDHGHTRVEVWGATDPGLWPPASADCRVAEQWTALAAAGL
jgi:hypothetical protein